MSAEDPFNKDIEDLYSNGNTGNVDNHRDDNQMDLTGWVPNGQGGFEYDPDPNKGVKTITWELDGKTFFGGENGNLFDITDGTATLIEETPVKKAQSNGGFGLGNDPNDTGEDGLFNGVPVFETQMESGNAFTLPTKGIFVGKGDKSDKHTLRHEFGHVLQARVWGLNFYNFAIIPTSLASTRSSYNHMSTWTEWSANYLSWSWFNKPADWDHINYPIGPTDPNNPFSSFPK
jgi:hypothetical protein